MSLSPKYSFSTAKFSPATCTADPYPSSFDTTAVLIQSLYDQIDELMLTLKRKTPKVGKQKPSTDSTLISEQESIQSQTQQLSLELEELHKVLQENEGLVKQAQMKRVISDYQQNLQQLKLELMNMDCQIKEHEQQLQSVQENQQTYIQLMMKLKEKQQNNDSVSKLLDSNGVVAWQKLQMIFDVDIIKTGVPVGYLIRLQLLLLKEIEALNDQQRLETIWDEKKQLLFEMNSQSALINQSLSFDQIVLNIIHQARDTSIPKSGILVQIQKCLNVYHQNFSWLAQSLNKYNLSHRVFEATQKDATNKQNIFKQLQSNKSQLLIECDKYKRKIKDMQQMQLQQQNQQEQWIEQESSVLLNLYLKDKESLMRDIKFKYGKAYHDHMILDVQQEFKGICTQQYSQNVQIIDNALSRINEIKKLLLKNKEQMQQLQNTTEQQHRQSNSELQSTLERVDKREYMLLLQNVKIELLQIENRMQKKIGQNQEQLLLDLSAQLKLIREDIDNNFIQIKQRSDSIDTVKRQKPIEHNRSQSQVPAVCIQLLDIQQLPITNPQEIMESQEDPIQTAKKQMDCNSYQLSFNQHPLKSLSCISGNVEQSFITQKENSINSSILDIMQNSNKSEYQQNNNKSQDISDTIQDNIPQFNTNNNQLQRSRKSNKSNDCNNSRIYKQQENNNIHTTINKVQVSLIVMLQLSNNNRQYDPISNYNDDPQLFGYNIYRLDEQLKVYSSKDKENMNSYTNCITQLDVNKFVLDHCSETALKFQRIYEPSIRQICQDSLALRHLNVRFYPFTLLGKQTIRGLALCESDLMRLQKLLIN